MSKLKGLNYLRKALKEQKGNPVSNTGNPLIDNLRNGNSHYQNNFNSPSDISGHAVDDSTFLTGMENANTTIADSIDELKAQRQPWISKATAGIGRVGAKAAAEIAKMPGVLGGIAAGAAGQLGDLATGEDNTDFMQTAFNNGWIKAVNNANEWVNNEALPVYVKKAIKEGNLWDNVMSIDFWATEGADGLGYIVSMLAPGAAINKLGLGSKLFTGAAKYGLLGDKVDNALTTLSKYGATPKNADLAAATLANTLFEAGAEAQGAMDGYEKSLRTQFENGEIDYEEYEDLKEKGSIIGRDVFLANAAILIGPNAVMSKMLWGGKKMHKSLDAEIGAGMLAKKTPKTLEKVGRVAKDIGIATAREGFFEEGMQSTAEHYFTERAIHNKDYDLGEFVQGYADMLQTTDGQKAILLGAVFGGGMQAFQGAKERKNRREETHSLIDLANENIDAAAKVLNTDVYVRDAEDNIVYEKNKDGNHVPKLDPVKVIEKLNGLTNLETESERYDLALARQDKEELAAIRENAMVNVVLPFVMKEGLGLDLLKQHLETSAETIKAAENENIDPKIIVEETMALARRMESDFSRFQKYAPSVINIEHDEATPEEVTAFYQKLSLDYVHHKEVKSRVNTAIENKSKDLADILDEKGIDRDAFDNNEGKRAAVALKDDRVKNLVKSLEYLEKRKEALTKKDDSFWNSKEINKQFAANYKKAKELEEELKEGEDKVTETLDAIEKADTKEKVDAVSKGQPLDEKKLKEEKAAVKEITDKVNANPSLDNLRTALRTISNLKISTFSTKEILNAIEKRIADTLAEQQAFSEFLDKLFEEVADSITDAKNSILDINASIRLLKSKQAKAIKQLEQEEKSPKGRNAKLIKQLIKETEVEIRKVDVEIARLEKEKAKLQKEVEKLTKAIDSIALRYGQVDMNDFRTVEDVISYIKENASKFKDHKFEFQRLLVHKHYTEENISALEDLIIDLETYRDVLRDTLLQKLKELHETHPDLNFLREELKGVSKKLFEVTNELKADKAKLDRLEKSITDKHVLKALTEELQFWEELQKTRKGLPTSKIYDNPVVNDAAIEKKRRIDEKEAKLKEEAKLRGEQAKENADKLAEALEEGKLTAEYFYEFVLNNVAVGEGIPNPPASFPVPQGLREKEGTYKLVGIEGDALMLAKVVPNGKEQTFRVSSKSFPGAKQTTTKPADTTAKSVDPMYNTEGALHDDIIEEGGNLPKDKEGNVIDNNLQEINNDARVITGTDSKEGLSFISSHMINHERTPRNKKGDEVTFEINTTYNKGNQGKALEKLPTATAADIEFLVNHLPINAVFSETAKAPLETYSQNYSLDKESREAYNKVFEKSSKLLRTAIIKEMVLNKTPISDISTTVAGQKSGSILVERTADNKVAENEVKELREFGGELKRIKTELIYVVNDKKVLENYKGKQYPLNRDLAPGEVYVMIHTANGTPFPLKLNIAKVKQGEAELLYELYKYRFDNDYKKVGKDLRIEKTNESIVAKVQEVFKDELAKDGLFDKNNKQLKDLSIGDVINFLIWDGTDSKKSQIRFDRGHLKVMNKTFTAEELANSKDAFVELLTENKRRNVLFKRAKDEDVDSFNFNNRSYVDYVLSNKILNTNAVTGKDENGEYRPTFGKDTTIYLQTNSVKVNNKLSDYNEAKKVTFKNTLRGKLSDLKTKLKGLFTKELALVGEDYYQEKNNPKGTKYSRISDVTSEKAKKENLTTPLYYNAAKRGDVVDALLRDYFSIGFKDKAAFIAKSQEYLTQVNKDKPLHGDIAISDNAFAELYNIVQEYEIEFNRRGYTIYSTTNPLFGTLTKNKKVRNTAGSMDLLARDKTGRYIIIDIKTSTSDRYENYQREDGGYYKEKDLRQQNGYAELFKQRTGVTVSEILILPITMESQRGKDIPVNSVYTSATRSKSPTGFIEVSMDKDIYEIMGETKKTSTDFSDPNKKKGSKNTGFKAYAKSEENNSFFNLPQQELASSEEAFLPNQELYSTEDASTDIPYSDLDQFELENEYESDMEDIISGLEVKYPDVFKDKKTTKKSSKKAAVKKPKVNKGRAVYFDKGGENMRVILFEDGKVEDGSGGVIKDAEIIKLAQIAGGQIADKSGKSEEEIRKDEKNSVSLQSTENLIENLDLDKIDEATANKMLIELTLAKPLKSLSSSMRRITTNRRTGKKEQLKAILELIKDKQMVTDEIRKICKL